MSAFDATEIAADLGGKLSQMMVSPESPSSPHGAERGTVPNSTNEPSSPGPPETQMKQEPGVPPTQEDHPSIPIGNLQGELQNMMSARNISPRPNREYASPRGDMMSPRSDMEYAKSAPIPLQKNADCFYAQKRPEYPIMMSNQYDASPYMYWQYNTEMPNSHQIMT